MRGLPAAGSALSSIAVGMSVQRTVERSEQAAVDSALCASILPELDHKTAGCGARAACARKQAPDAACLRCIASSWATGFASSGAWAGFRFLSTCVARWSLAGRWLASRQDVGSEVDSHGSALATGP